MTPLFRAHSRNHLFSRSLLRSLARSLASRPVGSLGRLLTPVSLLMACLALAPMANAGFIEVGASGSYRRSNIDTDAYDESKSITGSVSYYFNEASALELSYTDGTNKRVISESATNGHLTIMNYSSAGLDFVYTLGSRESVFRPYVKAGVNYILKKQIVDQYKQGNGSLFTYTAEDEPALVPSAGLGFKFSLSQGLSLKVGVDGWTSRPLSKEPVSIDYALRAGLSWMF